MDTVAFEAKLKADGFREIETKQYEPRPANGEHGHHFAVRGLILAGGFTITLDGRERTYRTGEIFEVDADRMHCEAVPPEGAQILVGRRY